MKKNAFSYAFVWVKCCFSEKFSKKKAKIHCVQCIILPKNTLCTMDSSKISLCTMDWL